MSRNAFLWAQIWKEEEAALGPAIRQVGQRVHLLRELSKTESRIPNLIETFRTGKAGSILLLIFAANLHIYQNVYLKIRWMVLQDNWSKSSRTSVVCRLSFTMGIQNMSSVRAIEGHLERDLQWSLHPLLNIKTIPTFFFRKYVFYTQFFRCVYFRVRKQNSLSRAPTSQTYSEEVLLLWSSGNTINY